METFSVMLFTNLCRYIGTREEIYIRRNCSLFLEKVFKLMSNFEQLDKMEAIISGSRAEGLMLPGSDYDVMCVITNVSIHVLPTSGTNLHQPDLIMETLNVKPGFVRLRVTDRFIYLQRYPDCMGMVDNTFYLSSSLFSSGFVRVSQQNDPTCVPHGPCAATKSVFNTDQDFVACFACRIWPEKASEWTHRNRPHNWPSTELVHCIVNDGCVLVPVGNRNSGYHHIEWRISFSVAERKLVFSMNHTQFLCYGLLKLYLKHVIESNEAVKDLLCSYFLKTCLFYCMEESDVRWEKENFINCFWTCFRLLYSWVRDGYCPNFFIRDNNMFEGKIFGNQQAKLLDHLSNLYSAGIDTFVLIPCLRDFISGLRGSLHPVLNRDLDFSVLGTELECLSDAETFAGATTFDCYPPSLLALDLVSAIDMIESNRMTTSLDSTFKPIQLYCYKHMLTQTLYHKYVYNAASNKDRYKHLKMLHNFILHECTDGDICTGWLHYATLCYITGQYNTVIHFVKHGIKQCKPYTMYSGLGKIVYEEDAYIENISGLGLTTLQKMKLVLASTYRVINSCCCYPREIEYEIIQNSHEEVAYIPPVVYSNVLLFLSYKRLGRTDLVKYTLNELYVAAHSDHFVTDPERPIALALLDKCVQLDND